MRAAILRSREGWHIDQLESELKRRGIEVLKFSITDISLSVQTTPSVKCKGFDLTTLDALIVRVIPLGSLEQLMFRMNALGILEKSGVKIINSPTSIEKTVDKSYTSGLLARAGLPTPRTCVLQRFDEAMDTFEKMGDVVVKPLHGSCGMGMTRISDKDIAYRVFRTMEMNRYIYYIQEFIEHGQEDTRIFVANAKVVAAMRRVGGGWKNNFTRGTRVELCDPGERRAAKAVEAARTLGLNYAGVDFLDSTDGSEYIIEVNGIPGWKGLQRTTDIRISEKIIDCVTDGTFET